MSGVWLVLTLLVLGLMQFLDTGLYTYIAYNLHVGGFYLGVLSATWSLVYIVSNKVFSRLADSGRNKVLLLLSSITLLLIYITLSDINALNGLILYSLHALALSAANLSLSVTILEIYDHISWNSVNAFSRIFSNFVRGSTFVLVALYSINLPPILILTTVFACMSTVVLPGIGLNVERMLFKINRDLSYVGKYLKASTALLYIHKPRDAFEYLERTWSNFNMLKPWRVLTSTVLYTMFGDLILVVLPLLMKDSVGLHGLWLSWGIGLLLTSFIIAPLISRVISTSENTDVKLMSLFILLRGIILVLLLPYIYDWSGLTTYLLLIIALSSIADFLIYNKFVEVSAGYSISNYYIAREVGSIIGSILGGLIYTLIPGVLPISVIIIAIASATLILV